MRDEAEGNLRRTVLQGPRREEKSLFFLAWSSKEDWATLIPIWLKRSILAKVPKLGRQMPQRAPTPVQVVLKLLSG